MKKLLFILCASAIGFGSAVAGEVTSQMSYSVQRSDGNAAGAKEKNEFNGGSAVYFESLGNDPAFIGWLEEKSGKLTYKNGWTRLILDWPVRVSSIVIRKASVGNKDFRGGSIVVEVQNPKGVWNKVYELQDKDIDAPVTIHSPLLSAGPIKGVRINFRTPAPITIGPIEVNS
ncbi:MAG TPA: hypothetical protein VNI58_04075 [Mariprofundaceae bacterium]|nr:hypothetical protein [Mariprofundaceae bacterium]